MPLVYAFAASKMEAQPVLGRPPARDGAVFPVYGPDLPGETLRALKEKETKGYGEYRTRRLVLEAFGKLAEPPGAERGRPARHKPRGGPHGPRQFGFVVTKR